MRGLVVLQAADLRLPLDPVCTAFDACESGHASVDGCLPTSITKSISEWHERWLYTDGVESPLNHVNEPNRADLNENPDQTQIAPWSATSISLKSRPNTSTTCLGKKGHFRR